MSKSKKNPKAAPVGAEEIVDPEKTLMAPSKAATQSKPDWVAAEDLLDSVEIPVSGEDDIDIEVVEDEFLGATLGKYQLLELIGEGGMGKVYLGEHTRIGRRAAIKLLRPKYAKRKDIVHRFFQEARAVNQIRHDNIIEITDFVEGEGEGGHTYLVMELLSGENLGDVLRRHESVELERALNIFIQICAAVQSAHQVGIVHRDLKPDNVFLVPRIDTRGEQREFVKVLDYGVAKLMGDAIAQEKKNVVIGTPAYMSPEQASAGEVDLRADIYSLGAIMYRVLCGRPVFEGSSVQDYVKKHLSETPIPPSQVIQDFGGRFPPDLEACILKCLEKIPADRFQSVQQLRETLIGIRDRLTGVAPSRPYADLPVAKPRRTFLWVLLSVLVAAVAAASTFYFIEANRPPRPLAPDLTTAPKPAPADPTQPKQIEINLVSVPLGAEVFRADDPEEKALGVTPFSARFPAGEGSVFLVFRLKGYKEHTASLQLSKNTGYLAELAPLADQKARPTGARKKTPDRRPSGQKTAVDKTQTLDPFAR